MTDQSLNDPVQYLLLGGVILDRYFEVERYPQAGSDALIRRAYERVGGCCLNVAITLKNLGGRPSIANMVGDDEIGLKIASYIKGAGLGMTCMQTALGRQSGYCLNILDASGERTFFTLKGCEAELPPEVAALPRPVGFAFAYVTGYFLLNRQTAGAVLALVDGLRLDGCKVLFDPGALVGEIDPALLRGILQRSDWITPNSGELVILQERLGVEQPATFFELGLTGIVLKKGSQGVEVITSGERFSLPGMRVTAVDSTGAGDSFAGGWMHALAHGAALRQAARLANACGALTTTFEGPHGTFSMEELHDFMATFKDNEL